MDSTQSNDRDTADRMHGRFDALDHGLFQEFRSYGMSMEGGALLNSRAWNRAAEANWEGTFTPVGDCRKCGSEMRPLPTEQVGRILWYSAQCVDPKCDGIIASPNAEVLRRSGRHDEMPQGFWDGRPKKRP